MEYIQKPTIDQSLKTLIHINQIVGSKKITGFDLFTNAAGLKGNEIK